MSKIRIKGDTSGYVDLETSASGSNLSIGGNTTVTGTAAITGPATISGPNNYEGLIVENTATDFAGGYMKIRDGNSTAGQYTWIGRNSDVTYIQSSNSNMAMQFTNAGVVTMPNTPYFSVYVNNGGSGNPSSGGALELVPFDAAEFNVGNHFNTSSKRFTAPVEGLYQFNWTLSTYNVAIGSWIRQRTFKNGSTYQIYEYKYSQSTADQHFASSFAYKLDQNDYIEFYANSSDASFTYSAGLTWNTCTGYLVG